MSKSGKPKKRRRSKDKGAFHQWVEYAVLVSLLRVVRLLPYGVCRAFAAVAGEAIFRLAPRRRRIARANLRIAFPELDETQRLVLAKRSCQSFVLTCLEGAKFLYRFEPRRAEETMREIVEGAEEMFEKVRAIHEDAGGCVFVVPHLGNWECLAHAGALAGIPLTIPVRPLDNRKLEAALYEMRASSGQEILAKKNAFFHLARGAAQGSFGGDSGGSERGRRGDRRAVFRQARQDDARPRRARGFVQPAHRADFVPEKRRWPAL